MKKLLTLSLLVMISILSNAQIKKVSYRGAFAPAPTPAWTDGWTNYDPNNTIYPSPTSAPAGGSLIRVPSSGSGTVISTNTTWTKNNTYVINGVVYVKSGVTLTIEPGTVIFGGNSVANSSLIICKGAKLNAIGTPTQPIVFTSAFPAGFRRPGQWGGIILLGKASLNSTSSATSPTPSTYGVNYIEGLTEVNNNTTGESTEFGGGSSPDDEDNSGTLKYVRIEFGGFIFSQNKEINGLTLGAIGRGTTIDYVQTSFINDDAFEWFGGTVNCSHLVSYRTVDDDWDTDFGFSGTVQFCLAVRDPKLGDDSYSLASGSSTSEGYESDNDAIGSNNNPRTKALFSNITNIGPLRGNNSTANLAYIHPAFRRAARIRRNSELKIFNSILSDCPTGLMIDNAAGSVAANAVSGKAKFKNNIISGVRVGGLTETAGTLPAGFVARDFFYANSNDSAQNASVYLTKPYGLGTAPAVGTDWAISYFTSADYRPIAGGLAASGADFTDSSFTLHGWSADTCIAPAQPSIITGATNINQCDSLQTYSVTAVTGTTYFWSVTGTGNTVVSGNGSNSVVIKMKVAGTISVVASSGCASSVARTLAVIKAVPTAPGSIFAGTSGTKAVNTNICLFNASAFASTGVADTMRIRSVANATGYIWEIPGATITTVNDTTVAVVFADTTTTLTKIRVYTKSACDTSLPKVQSLTRPAIAAPGTVFRTFVGTVGQAAVTNVCSLISSGTTTTYTIRKVATATSYIWSIKGGTTHANFTVNNLGSDRSNDTSITVTFLPGFTVDSITVQSVNGCTVSARRGVRPSALALPATPASITSSTGVLSACRGASVDYTAAPGTATATQSATASYRWTVPANTTITSASTDSSTITVSFGSTYTGGALTARAVTACGAIGVARSVTLTRSTTGCPTGRFMADAVVETETPSTQLYPNPNNGNFTLKLNTGAMINDIAQIKVVDLSGRVVYQTNAKTINGNLSTNLQSNISNGVYMVVCTINGKTQTLRMVVQK